jgi:hypothetical protein
MNMIQRPFHFKQTFILPYFSYQDVVLDPLNLCLAMYEIYLMYHIKGFAYSQGIHVPPFRTAAQDAQVCSSETSDCTMST